MEDPAGEIEFVLRSLVCQPTLAQQAKVIDQFFSPDCSLYHPYVNISPQNGIEGVKAGYQTGELLVNYQNVKFHNIVYDPAQELLVVRGTMYLKPWLRLLLPTSVDIFILLELEKFESKDGRELKRIKVQRDFFQRSLILLLVPLIGDIYNSNTWRSLSGYVLTSFVKLVKKLIGV